MRTKFQDGVTYKHGRDFRMKFYSEFVLTTDHGVPHISLVFCEMWETTKLYAWSVGEQGGIIRFSKVLTVTAVIYC